MTFLGSLIHLVARGFERVGYVFVRLGSLLRRHLPAVFTPAQLQALLEEYYTTSYYQENSLTDEYLLETAYLELERWEADVACRYGIDSGTLLVLGCGHGREAIALAERKVNVVGLERHRGVLAVAQKRAAQAKVRVNLLQADFLALPHAPHSFDFAFLSGTMYSAIPGLTRRQVWLADLGRVMKPEGLIVLSFQRKIGPPSRADRLTTPINRILVKLPGGNPDYQLGDTCDGGHFFHLFQDEQEIRTELEGAGFVVRELSWHQQYAVISRPFPDYPGPEAEC